MNLTRTIVRRPMAALMIILAIVVFGAMSIIGMDQESIPDMDMPMMLIMTTYTGADPENIDKLVSTPIEGAVGTLSGLDSVTSISSDGASIVLLQYEFGIDMTSAYIDLKDAMERVVSSLPDAASTPTVLQINLDAMASMSLSVRSHGRDNLLQFVEDDLSPEFERLSTVAEVSVTGGQEDYISVTLIEENMTQYGLNMSSVVSAVSGADFSQPSGSIDHGSQSLTLTSSVQYRSVEDLRNMPITLTNGNVIRLEDVANVYDAKREAESASRYNGEETISIGLTKRQSSTAVALSQQVKQTIAEINDTYDDIEIEVISDDADTIQESINSVAQTLIIAVIISMIILFIFLGNIRASLIIGSSMPVSLLVAFICMSMMGFTLNIITMGAMVLGVGMMVDNSVVVIDSCFKNAKDRTFQEAAVEGTRFVTMSIVASTITTVVVFLPLATVSGMAGEMFGPLGFTVVFALLASLFSALTLVPLFFVQFKPVEKKNAPAARLLKLIERAYARLLRGILDKKKTVFAVAMALIVGALFLATGLNMELIPSTDEGTISISIDMRPGTQLAKADAIVLEIEEMVAAHPDVESYTSSAGGSSGMSSLTGGGSGSVTAYLRSDRDMKTADLVEQWRLDLADMSDCDITVSSSSSLSMGLSSDEVTVALTGNDFDTLKEFADEVADVFRTHPSIITVSTSLSDGNPQAEIIVDDQTAAYYGFTAQLVATNVYQALSGVDATSIARDGQDYTVTVEYEDEKYTNMSDVQNMILTSATGQSVALNDIAQINYTNAPSSIQKLDSNYNVTVTGTPLSSDRFTAQDEIDEMVAAMQFPDGISLTEDSMTQMMNETFASLGQAILVAVLLVFMVMTIQFESIKHSVMVMVCIPFSLIGAIGLLAMTGTTLNMTSLLGFLVLVGTVVNNGILFVDTTNRYRQETDVKTALVRTGRHRLRPILMTSLTTILAMIPMAVGIGTGSEMMAGMGIVVIGGMTASTLLTLLLLPTFYLIIDGNPEKRAQKKERRRIKREEKVRAIMSGNAAVEETEEV